MRSTLSLLLALLCFVHHNVQGQTLLVAHNNDILQLDLEKNSSSAVVSADSPVVAFDVHPVWRHVYWATDYRIYRTPLYDLRTTTVMAVTGQVGSVVVDWVHHAVYWTDMSMGRVEVVHADGRRRRIVYESQGVLGALALDPFKGKLFWIEYIRGDSELKRIKSSDTFGIDIKTVYESENIQNGSPLELDLVYMSINFYQRNKSRSEQWEINYTGLEPRVMLFSAEQPPVSSLSLTMNGFFYADEEGLHSGVWVKKQYLFVFSNNSRDDFDVLKPYFKLVDEKLKNARQIRVLSDVIQPSLPDDCTHHLCEQECFLRSRGLSTAHCGCGYGFRLRDDNRTCFEQGYIFCSTATTFERFTYDGGKLTTLYNESTANIQSFDLDAETGFLYWSDLFTQAIYRAPLEHPTRSQVIVEGVAAYGVAVDVVHEHIYWTDDSRITVGSLDGKKRVTLLTDLDDPAHLVVDPVNRYIFWAECGYSLSLRRAGLDGSDVTGVVDHVTCGAILSVVPSSRTLYWLDWGGSLHACEYDGSGITTLMSEAALAMITMEHGVLWLSADEETAVSSASRDPLFQMNLETITDKPRGLRVVKKSQHFRYNSCETSNCAGICLPSTDKNIPICVCPNGTKTTTDCSADNKEYKEDSSAKGYFEIVEIKAFSVVLRCTGTLLRYSFLHPFIQVTEVDSLVPRDNTTRLSRVVRVDNKTLPFTVDALNPATSYSVTVRNRVTRASASLEVHTAPPPLAVRRLPVVMTPGATLPLAWRTQGIHLSSPNVWEDFLQREFILLLITKRQYYLSNSFDVVEPVLRLVKEEVKDYFMVLKYYKSEEEFDDDPEMHLGNVPWGEELRLAMVQITEYKNTYSLDFVYSHTFGLPDHRWVTLLENILQDQRSKERATP